ncbi:MAG TPA: hypothetical protein VGI85_15205 [Chthoniobacterales bacterium]
MALSLFVVSTLATALWVVTMPVARARTLTPAEMIQENLPPGKTMQTATKQEFLSAVCVAVRKYRPAAPEITKVAVRVHREYAGDSVATVLRCTPSGDCEFVENIVRAGVLNAASQASAIQDAALSVAPDCADAIQDALARDGKEILAGGKEILEPPAEGPAGPIALLPPPGSVPGAGGFNPPGHVQVCDNGTQRSISQDQLAEFLSSHPGSFVGTCQPTPTQNR